MAPTTISIWKNRTFCRLCCVKFIWVNASKKITGRQLKKTSINARLKGLTEAPPKTKLKAFLPDTEFCHRWEDKKGQLKFGAAANRCANSSGAKRWPMLACL